MTKFKNDVNCKIHVDLSCVQSLELSSKLFKYDNMILKMALKIASQYERDIFTYALEKRVLTVYMVQWNSVSNEEIDGVSTCRYDNAYKFESTYDDAKSTLAYVENYNIGCMPNILTYDLGNVVGMSDEEFEQLCTIYKGENGELVRIYRTTMRNLLIPNEEKAIIQHEAKDEGIDYSRLAHKGRTTNLQVGRRLDCKPAQDDF